MKIEVQKVNQKTGRRAVTTGTIEKWAIQLQLKIFHRKSAFICFKLKNSIKTSYYLLRTRVV